MIAWVFRDGAWRGWLLWLALGGLNTSLLMNLLLMDASRRGGSISATPVLLVAWAGLTLYLLFGQTRTRCGAFQLSLPLDARRIWIAHTAAVSAAASLQVAAMIGIAFTLARVLGRPEAQHSEPLSVLSVLASGVTGAILASVLVQIPSPRLARVPFSLRYASWFVLSLAAVAALAIACAPLGVPWALAPLALAAMAVAVAVRHVPRAFTLVPFAAGSESARMAAGTDAAAGTVATGAAAAWRTRRQVAAALVQSVSSGHKEWFGLPFIVLFGVVAGGGLGPIDSDLEVLRYAYLFMAAYLLFAMTGPRTCRLHHLDALPVSRRRLFALMVLPYAFAFAGGYGAGALLQSRYAGGTELVEYTRTHRGYEILVPSSAWEAAFGEEARAIRAAAQERRLQTLPVWRGLDAALYSPYAAPAGSPLEVVAGQISRAAAAVYGAEIPPSEIAARYLETRPDGAVAPRGEGLTLRRDHPDLAPRDPGPMFPVLVTSVLVPWLLLSALLFRTYREGVSDRVRYVVVFAPAAFVLIASVGLAVLMIMDVSGPWVIQAAYELPLRAMAGSAAVPLVWILCAALSAGAYAVAQREFQRMEIPARPFRFTLVDWLREEP